MDKIDARKKILQLKDTFGITVDEAESTLNYYHGNVDSATRFLTEQLKPFNADSLSEVAYGPENRKDAATSTIGRGSPSEENTGTSGNLTQSQEFQDDLQRALALSMQDMHDHEQQQRQQQTGTISYEDQELSRALEASIRDTQTNMQQMGVTGPIVDPLNPLERRRVGDTPVGLKNIGNTCWFSAVIQSLFHLPVFRECILSYTPPCNTSDTQVPVCVQFMCELQKLFVLLLKSSQKYINPLPAIEVLRTMFRHAGAGSQQEDVSEFTHILLERIEDAFATTIDKDKTNPVAQLFTGESVTEGMIDDQPFVNTSQFGAFPVQVEGHAHLHDSLEAATVYKELQQETWFSRLPPVLVFELSRFKFNQRSAQTEKIHDRLSFDQLVFMDRYLYGNKDETRQRRKEVGTLLTKISQLQHRLQSFMNYEGRNISLAEVLQLTQKYVSSIEHPVLAVSCDKEQREEEEHCSSNTSTLHKEAGQVQACLDIWLHEVNTETTELQENLAASQEILEAVYADQAMNRTCYQLHAVLVHQGQASGGHYWAYVRKTASTASNSLQTNNVHSVGAATGCPPPPSVSTGIASTIDHTHIESSDQSDLQVPSQSGDMAMSLEKGAENLEGDDRAMDSRDSKVMVGEGDGIYVDDMPCSDEAQLLSPPAAMEQGSVGSKAEEDETGAIEAAMSEPTDLEPKKSSNKESSQEEVWLKFNDISVTEVTWEEVKRESFGGISQGIGNTSAYCLMYVSQQSAQLWKHTEDNVSAELQRVVADSNLGFEKEILEYQQHRSSKEHSQALIKPAKAVRFASTERFSRGGSSEMEMEAYPSDAKRARPASPVVEDMQVDITSLLPVHVDPLLLSELSAQVTRKYQQVSTDLPPSASEPRLLSELHYAVYCGDVAETAIKALILGELAEEFNNEGKTTLSLLARRDFINLVREPVTENAVKQLKSLYSQFCTMCYHLIQTAKLLKAEKWPSMLSHLCHSYAINCDIIQATSEKYGLDRNLLGAARAKTMLEVSDIGTVTFNRGGDSADLNTALLLGNELVAPGISALSKHLHPGDEAVMEQVREEWCRCLDKKTLTSEESDKLADLLVKIVEDNSKGLHFSVDSSSSVLDAQKLVAQFTSAYDLLKATFLKDKS